MKKLNYWITGVACLFLMGMQVDAQNGMSAKEIMQKSRDVSKMAGMESVTQLRIVDAKGRERIRKITMASRDEGNVEKRIIKFLEPADVKGTGLLVFDYEHKNDEMWLYLPALRKTRKIVSSEKGRNFMGSEFSNADMAAPNLPDFMLKKLPDEKAGGVDCYKIEMTPLSNALMREYAFAKKIVWIGKKDFVMRKAVYYDRDGEIHKVLTAGDVAELDPVRQKYMAREMSVVNKLNGRKSYIKMLQVQYNPHVNPEYFTLTYLQK